MSFSALRVANLNAPAPNSSGPSGWSERIGSSSYFAGVTIRGGDDR